MGPLAHRLASQPLVVVGVLHGEVDENWLELCDVVVGAGDPVLGAMRRTSNGSRSRLPPLRSCCGTSRDGWSTRAWWRSPRSTPSCSRDPSSRRGGLSIRSATSRTMARAVRVKREGPRLILTLTRPDRLNALDARMRDELIEGLAVAAADPGITVVELRGEGPAFCAGGDLDEFGSRSDPASAHILRLQRSIGRELSNLGARTTAYVHGACVGSGIELAAFTDRVVAAADTRIALPEIGLGLVPGAGGTVSLTRRIGRFRTAWLAFSGSTIDAGRLSTGDWWTTSSRRRAGGVSPVRRSPAAR